MIWMTKHNTHTRLTASFPGLTRSAVTRRVKPIWISLKRDSEWQWHQLGHMQVCTSFQTDNHASTPTFFTGLMRFLPPNQQRQSTEGNQLNIIHYSTITFSLLISQITPGWAVLSNENFIVHGTITFIFTFSHQALRLNYNLCTVHI